MWIVDPIDGTRGYLAGREDWCVSVALVEDAAPVLAAVFAPASDEFFFAMRGEGATRNGERIAVSAVTADVGNVAAGLAPQERAFIKSNPVDVEDWGMLTLTFSDGTKSTVFSGDMIMGGVRNLIETYTSGGSLFANITPNTHMMSYQTSEEKLADVYITEKVDRKTGWQYVCLEEEWTRGYLQEIQEFMECAATGRQPLSDLALAFETIKVNYAGYWAAEDGRRVAL